MYPAACIDMKQKVSKRLLNEHEVAGTCGISVLTLRKWRNQRRGPRFLKIGCLVRYRQQDVSAWIDGQKAVTCEQPEVAR
jgi:predicted DNA-binding transcriptional regulator AlpA